MNYYDILGVKENASQDDIKKAYKKLAMTHHPDRGGDNKKFQEISQAYDTLSDPNKRSHYDAEANGFANPFGDMQGQGFPNFGEMFGFHFGQGFAQPPRRENRDLSIRITVTFKQSFLGTQIEARYPTPSGKSKTVVIDVPGGIQSGQVIRYGGLGDDTNPNWPPGDLNVTVMVETSPDWIRRGDDLCRALEINVLEAMTGCVKQIDCLDGTSMPINIKPGVQHGAEYASGGRGFKNINTGRSGALIIVVSIVIPSITDPQTIKKLESIYAEINHSS
jgi:curved DNA-binding protein